MAEEAIIDDLAEKAIIDSFKRAEKGILPRRSLIEIVKNYMNACERCYGSKKPTEQAITQKIRKMLKAGFLIRPPSLDIKHAEGLYELNPDIEFKFVGEFLPSLTPIAKIPGEIRNKHTSDLKKIIELWIRYFPKPNYDYCCLADTSGIDNFKNHPLFQDLQNHIPHINNNLCSEWNNYTDQMKRLENMKKELFNLFNDEINKCFGGYLEFAPFFDYEFIAGEYCDPKCDAIPCYIYYYVLELQLEGANKSSLLKELDAAQNMEGPDGAAYMEYDRAISAYKQGNVPKHNIFRYLGVNEREFPEFNEEVDKLIKNFLIFFSTIEKSRFMELGKNIAENIYSVSQEREKMIKELQRVLFYPSFPGDCEYLRLRE